MFVTSDRPRYLGKSQTSQPPHICYESLYLFFSIRFFAHFPFRHFVLFYVGGTFLWLCINLVYSGSRSSSLDVFPSGMIRPAEQAVTISFFHSLCLSLSISLSPPPLPVSQWNELEEGWERDKVRCATVTAVVSSAAYFYPITSKDFLILTFLELFLLSKLCALIISVRKQRRW